MLRRAAKILSFTSSLTLCLAAAALVASPVAAQISLTPTWLPTPIAVMNLRILSTGLVSWGAVLNAQYYVISIAKDGVEFFYEPQYTETEYQIEDFDAFADYRVEIVTRNANEDGDSYASYTYTAPTATPTLTLTPTLTPSQTPTLTPTLTLTLTPTRLPTPIAVTNLRISSTGLVSWGAVANAQYYVISIAKDGVEFFYAPQYTETEYQVEDFDAFAGYVVEMVTRNANEDGDSYASYTYTAPTATPTLTLTPTLTPSQTPTLTPTLTLTLTPTRLPTPIAVTNLRISSTGLVSWGAVLNAQYYVISIAKDGVEFFYEPQYTETEYQIEDFDAFAGYRVEIVTRNANEDGDSYASYTYTPPTATPTLTLTPTLTPSQTPTLTSTLTPTLTPTRLPTPIAVTNLRILSTGLVSWGAVLNAQYYVISIAKDGVEFFYAPQYTETEYQIEDFDAFAGYRVEIVTRNANEDGDSYASYTYTPPTATPTLTLTPTLTPSQTPTLTQVRRRRIRRH